MSTTVRVIFWGLMALAPDPQGEKGMTALLVDPQLAQNVNTPCQVPRHLPAVYLFEGQCEGDCVRIPPDRRADAQSMGFKEMDGRPVAVHGGDLELAWLLEYEDLDLSGDESGKVKLKKPFFNFSRRRAPRTQRQASYFSWVQDMDSLTAGSGRLRLDCSRGEITCPIRARFMVQGGEASACHIFHLPGSEDSQEVLRDVRLFDYTTPDNDRYQRAVADAVLVQYTAPGDSVVLTSRSMPGMTRTGGSATLKPDAQGRLTLVVVNFPPTPGLHNPACPQPHSDFLLRLLAIQPTTRTTRNDHGKATEKAHPGACEPESVRLAKLLRTPGEPPHSTTACDIGSTRP